MSNVLTKIALSAVIVSLAVVVGLGISSAVRSKTGSFVSAYNGIAGDGTMINNSTAGLGTTYTVNSATGIPVIN